MSPVWLSVCTTPNRRKRLSLLIIFFLFPDALATDTFVPVEISFSRRRCRCNQRIDLWCKVHPKTSDAFTYL